MDETESKTYPPDVLDKFYTGADEAYPFERGESCYQSIEDVILSRFNWCGCGQPQTAVLYLLTILHFIDDRSENRFNGQWPSLDGLFASPGERYFVLYTLNSLGITEHGGGVDGSWLTGDGKELLDELKAYRARMNDGRIEDINA